MGLLSIFQTVGSVAGIVTFCYVTWDRWISRRPYAVLIAHLSERALSKRLHLRLVNPTDFPLIFDMTAKGGDARVGLSNGTEDAVRYAAGGRTNFVVEAHSERILPVWGPAGLDGLPPDEGYSIILRWRRAQGRQGPWLRGVINVSTSPRNVRELLTEEHQYHRA